jgi:hypothetical protein
MNKTGKKIDWKRSNQRNEREKYSDYRNRWILKDGSNEMIFTHHRLIDYIEQDTKHDYF